MVYFWKIIIIIYDVCLSACGGVKPVLKYRSDIFFSASLVYKNLYPVLFLSYPPGLIESKAFMNV